MVDMMKIEKIRYVIAQRSLRAGNDLVVVTIGKPEFTDDENDYYCSYSIEFKGDKRLSYACGIDSIQAIQLVIKKIGSDLVGLSNKINLPISWFPDTPGETGFS